jgi:hypothetical protein
MQIYTYYLASYVVPSCQINENSTKYSHKNLAELRKTFLDP